MYIIKCLLKGWYLMERWFRCTRIVAAIIQCLYSLPQPQIQL